MLKIEFLGALACVGASGVLLDAGSEKILLDYGADVEETPPRPPLPVPSKIDAIVATHAHLDHVGSIPIVMKRNPVPVFGLPVTEELTELLLKDSLKLNIEAIGDIEEAKLPFEEHDIQTTMKKFVKKNYHTPFKIRNSQLTFFDAGHIPGSALVLIENLEKKILYTGNYNTIDTRLLKRAEENLPEFDILITESTYSDRDHPDRKKTEREFIESVRHTIANEGVALISSFAVGRAQEILLVLDKYGIDFPVYMDGMAKKATTIINKYKKFLRQPDALDSALEKVKFVSKMTTRRKIVREPCAIITTSGMLNGGPIVPYIEMLYSDERASLLLTGWQAKGSAGKILLETGRFPIKGKEVEVKMNVKRFDFSAHLGRKQLFEFIEKHNPQKIFCVHGDHTEEFAEELRQKGFDAVAPVANNRIFFL
jgi:putative mRNA 3-end processing factor